ncbi:unnamed protein product [Moneuplotes crassus]|uniref:Uncharacterized protein n=1 Tax=Euplotes crassus TaxID=5936 RepID=A0AAD1XFW0_EUPCR|nr:unnamed protein product [Moneuplotes crassus]
MNSISRKKDSKSRKRDHFTSISPNKVRFGRSIHKRIQRLFETQTYSSKRRNIKYSPNLARKNKPKGHFDRVKIARVFSPKNPSYRKLYIKFKSINTPKNRKHQKSIKKPLKNLKSRLKVNKTALKSKNKNITVTNPSKPIKLDCLSQNSFCAAFKRGNLGIVGIDTKKANKLKKEEQKKIFMSSIQNKRKISSGYIDIGKIAYHMPKSSPDGFLKIGDDMPPLNFTNSPLINITKRPAEQFEFVAHSPCLPPSSISVISHGIKEVSDE